MTALDVTLAEFTSDMKRIRDLLGLIKRFREFGSSAPPEQILDKAIAWDEAMALKDAAPGLRTDLPLMSGSMLLYICGRFEYFVRQIVEGFVDEIVGAAASYDHLPPVLRNELKRRTLEFVSYPSRYGASDLEAQALLVELVSNMGGIGGSGPISVSARVLTVTDSNMRPDVLNDLMKRVDIKDVWKDIGKQARIKTFLNETVDGECTNTARRKLNELMNLRNKIAHPTSGIVFPDPDHVYWVADYLNTLGGVLVDVCNVHLSVFRPTAPTIGVDPFN